MQEKCNLLAVLKSKLIDLPVERVGEEVYTNMEVREANANLPKQVSNMDFAKQIDPLAEKVFYQERMVWRVQTKPPKCITQLNIYYGQTYAL